MELLKFMLELDIWNYLILGFVIEIMIYFPIGEKSNYKYRNVSTLLATFIIIVKLIHA